MAKKKKKKKNKKKLAHVNYLEGIAQIPAASKVLIETPEFIHDKKLWKGFLKHKWVLLFSIVIAILFSSILFQDLREYFFSSKPDLTETFDSAKQTIRDVNQSLIETDVIKEGEKIVDEEKIFEKHTSVFSGSLKFLLLIFLEVLIFHFSVTTNNILKDENKTLIFKDFFKAEKRMILIMGRNWALGIAMYTIVSTGLNLIGYRFLIEEIMFVIYGFYLGFAFLDNYLEQFQFTIKESTKCIQKHFGAAIVFGLFASITMNIPLIGPLAVPFICAIAATRYGHLMRIEDFKLELDKS